MNTALVEEDSEISATFYNGSILDYFFANGVVFPEKYDVYKDGFSDGYLADYFPLILRYYI